MTILIIAIIAGILFFLLENFNNKITKNETQATK